MKKIATLIMAVVLVISNVGCATMMKPSLEEMQNADYGEAPTNYEETVKAYFKTRLKDPYSAVYEFPAPPSQGYVTKGLIDGGGHVWGWLGEFTLNAKNGFGGYTGVEHWAYLIKNNKLRWIGPKNPYWQNFKNMMQYY